jgi:hypothetical protein
VGGRCPRGVPVAAASVIANLCMSAGALCRCVHGTHCGAAKIKQHELVMARLQDQHGMSDAAVDGMARGQEYVRTTRARGVGLVLEGDWLSCPPPPLREHPLIASRF